MVIIVAAVLVKQGCGLRHDTIASALKQPNELRLAVTASDPTY